MSRPVKTDTVTPFSLGDTVVRVDSTFLFDLKILLTDLHGRYCSQVNDCCDMEQSTCIAGRLYAIVEAYNDAEECHALLQERESDPLKL